MRSYLLPNRGLQAFPGSPTCLVEDGHSASLLVTWAVGAFETGWQLFQAEMVTLSPLPRHFSPRHFSKGTQCKSS